MVEDFVERHVCCVPIDSVAEIHSNSSPCCYRSLYMLQWMIYFVLTDFSICFNCWLV
jgi:hypothetical protein